MELNISSWKSNSSLKAYYRFESGALTTDSSGNSHTLTDLNSCSETTGKFGGGVVMGTNDAYSAVNHADFRPTGNFTIIAWVKRSATGAATTIMQSYSDNPNVAGWSLRINASNNPELLSGKNSGSTNNVDFDIVAGATDICDGNWHQVVGTWDGSNLNIYVDGYADSTAVGWANAPSYAATNYIRIGCGNSTGSDNNFITGYLDDIGVINGIALTAGQVLNLFQNGKPKVIIMD